MRSFCRLQLPSVKGSISELGSSSSFNFNCEGKYLSYNFSVVIEVFSLLFRQVCCWITWLTFSWIRGRPVISLNVYFGMGHSMEHNQLQTGRAAWQLVGEHYIWQVLLAGWDQVVLRLPLCWQLELIGR